MSEDILNCHLCSENCEESKDTLAVCCKKKCRKVFCQKCIISKINKDFKVKTVKPETWVCYTCGGSCPCQACSQKNRSTVLRNQDSSHRALRSTSRKNDKQLMALRPSTHSKIAKLSLRRKFRGSKRGDESSLRKEASSTSKGEVCNHSDDNVRATRSSTKISEPGKDRELAEKKRKASPPEKKIEQIRGHRTQNKVSLGTVEKEEERKESTCSGMQEEKDEKGKADEHQSKRSLRGQKDALDYYKPEIIDNMKRKTKRDAKKASSKEYESLTSPFNAPSSSKIQIMIINPVVENVANIGKAINDEKMPVVENIDFETGLSQIIDKGNIIESVKVEVNKTGNFVNLKRKNGKIDIVKIENRYLYKKKLLKFNTSFPKLEHKTTLIQTNEIS